MLARVITAKAAMSLPYEIEMIIIRLEWEAPMYICTPCFGFYPNWVSIEK